MADSEEKIPGSTTLTTSGKDTDMENNKGQEEITENIDTSDPGVTVIYSRKDTPQTEFLPVYRERDAWTEKQAFHQGGGFNLGSTDTIADVFGRPDTALCETANSGAISTQRSHGNEQITLPADGTGQTLIQLKDCHGVHFPETVPPVDEAFNNIRGTTEELMKQENPVNYVSTFAERAAFKLLKQFGSIIIKGRSGTGKTRIARKLLKDISKETDFIPLEITSSRQWDAIPARSGKRYAVMIDDIFGSSNFVQSRFNDWELVMPSMWPHAEKGNIKFILTSRTEIMSECEHLAKKYKFISTAKSVTLDENEFMLRKCEKKKFLMKYCSKVSFTDDELQEIVEIQTTLGFPQCCLFFAKNKNAQQRGIHYFQKPHEFLKEEISSLQSQDSLAYLVLLLVVMKKGSLDLKLLIPYKVNKDFKELVENTAQACIIGNVPTVASIKKKADELCSTYLTKSKYKLQFQHQSVYDAIILNISQEYPEVGVELSPASVLVELVRTQTHRQKEHEVAIPLTADNYDTLAARVTDILQSEENVDILDHQCLRDEQFVQVLLQTWEENTVKNILKQPNPNSTVETYVLDSHDDDTVWLEILRNFHAIPVRRICLFTYDHIVAFFVLKELTLLTDFILESYFDQLSSQSIAQILTCCVYKNRKGTTEFLMKRNARPVPDTIRALCAAAEVDQKLTSMVLGAFKENVSSLGELGHLLSIALFCGNSEMVTYLTENMKTKSEHMKTFRMCLKQLAAQCTETANSGFELNFVPRKDFDVTAVMKILMSTKCGIDLDFLVNLASGHNDPSVLRYLLQNKVNMEKMYSGKSSLHVAVQFGSYECVVELVNNGADVAAVTQYKDAEVYNERDGHSVSQSSVLHFAARSTRDKCRKLLYLLEVLHDLNIKKLWKHTLLAGAECRDLMTEVELDEAIEEAGLYLTDKELDEAIALNKEDVEEYLPTLDPRLTVKQFNVDLKDIKNRTPLQLASRFRCKSYFSSFEQTQQSKENNEFVEELIKRGADINLKDKDDYTALHYATANGNTEVVNALLKAGAQTDITDGDGSSFFHFIAGRRTYYKEDDISLLAKKSLCEVFLKANCDINAVDNKGRTCLHEAAKHGDLPMLQFLLRNGANIDAQDNEGKTVLHEAAREGDMDMITFLCEKGACLGLTDNNGETVLHEAAKSKEDAVIKLQYILKKKDTLLKIADKRGRTAIFPAAESGDTEVVEFLVEKGLPLSERDVKDNTLLHRACKYKEIGMVTFLLKSGLNVNEVNKRKKSSLHLALNNRFSLLPSVVEALLDKGADPDKVCADGNAPLLMLHYENRIVQTAQNIVQAAQVEHCVELLLAKDADANVKNKTGMTPLHLAAKGRNSKCVKLLLDHRADTNIKDLEGRTALHVAMKKISNEACVTMLLDKALESSQVDDDGCTLLHHMAASGNFKAMKSLLQRGVNPNISNKQGKTALNVVKGTESLEVLLSHSIDLDHSDEDGTTALHAFVKARDIKSVRLMLAEGANPSLQDKKGNTALHMVCQGFVGSFFSMFRDTSAVEIAELLIRYECNASLRNSMSQTAFDIITRLPSHTDAQMETSRKELSWLLQ